MKKIIIIGIVLMFTLSIFVVALAGPPKAKQSTATSTTAGKGNLVPVWKGGPKVPKAKFCEFYSDCKVNVKNGDVGLDGKKCRAGKSKVCSFTWKADYAKDPKKFNQFYQAAEKLNPKVAKVEGKPGWVKKGDTQLFYGQDGQKISVKDDDTASVSVGGKVTKIPPAAANFIDPSQVKSADKKIVMNDGRELTVSGNTVTEKTPEGNILATTYYNGDQGFRLSDGQLIILNSKTGKHNNLGKAESIGSGKFKAGETTITSLASGYQTSTGSGAKIDDIRHYDHTGALVASTPSVGYNTGEWKPNAPETNNDNYQNLYPPGELQDQVGTFPIGRVFNPNLPVANQHNFVYQEYWVDNNGDGKMGKGDYVKKLNGDWASIGANNKLTDVSETVDKNLDADKTADGQQARTMVKGCKNSKCQSTVSDGVSEAVIDGTDTDDFLGNLGWTSFGGAGSSILSMMSGANPQAWQQTFGEWTGFMDSDTARDVEAWFASDILGTIPIQTDSMISEICRLSHPIVPEGKGFALLETQSGTFQTVASIEGEYTQKPVPFLCDDAGECKEGYKCDLQVCYEVDDDDKFKYDSNGKKISPPVYFYKITWGVTSPQDEKFTPFIDENNVSVSFNVYLYTENRKSKVGLYKKDGKDVDDPIHLSNGDADRQVFVDYATSKKYKEACIMFKLAPADRDGEAIPSICKAIVESSDESVTFGDAGSSPASTTTSSPEVSATSLE